MNYINLEKKIIVGRNNNPVPPLNIDYDTLESVAFTFINSNNQIQQPPSGSLYFAGSLKMGELPSSILFYSDEATTSGTTLSFLVDTYTAPYIEQIKKKYTEINIEIGQTVDGMKHVLLRDVAFASPRVYIEGVAPSSAVDLATKEWVLEQGFIPADGAEEIISGYVMQAVSGLNIPSAVSQLVNDEGFVDETYVTTALSSKQDLITAQKKLSYSLLSGTPSIPTKTSDLTNDSGYATSSYVQAQVSGKQDKIDNAHKLAYSLLSGTPSIPTKTSDLTNDSGYATSSYVQAQVSGKQDTLTFDSTPTSASLNPVTSNGIYQALQNIQPRRRRTAIHRHHCRA